MMTLSDLKNLAQNTNGYTVSSSAYKIFIPPIWFHCNGQTFLVSQIVSVLWNVQCLSEQTFKTQVSLANGVIINIFGKNRAAFASQCLNLKADFKDDNFDSELVFKL